jgi:hypothetical protein
VATEEAELVKVGVLGDDGQAFRGSVPPDGFVVGLVEV